VSASLRRVVLTGASGGLGRAMAAALAGDCDAMVLAGRDGARLAVLKRELQSRHAALAVETVAGDLTRSATRRQVRDACRALPQPVDVLINNAGINEFHEFESQEAGDVGRMLEVNLLAPMLLTQELLPLLKAAPSAQIVNVGSIFGYLGYPGFAAYCATKFGLRGFSQSLRRELADTAVKVRYFAPRTTRTALNSPAVSAMNRALGAREDTPEAVARELVRFLASDAWERKIGFPERLYVFLNQLVPAVNDKGIRAQLSTIKQHLPAAAPPRAGRPPALSSPAIPAGEARNPQEESA
jgi:short-subunit dehydrogenase